MLGLYGKSGHRKTVENDRKISCICALIALLWYTYYAMDRTMELFLLINCN